MLLIVPALLTSWRYAEATEFELGPGQVLVGSAGEYVTREEDTLPEVARANDLGYGQLMAVNTGIDPWLPGAGRRIVLPSAYLIPMSPRPGIVINLAEQRLYYFPANRRTVETYPIGVGVEADMTPLGTTRVVGKDVRPTWYPPKSIREEKPELPAVVPAGPDNPLGEYAFRLGWPMYRIHGTNKPYGVGRHVSHGCIRLYPEDIKRLFEEVSIGTPVRVIDEPIRLAWVAGELYLAVNPSRTQIENIGLNQPPPLDVPPELRERVLGAAGSEAARVDWTIVDDLGIRRPGIPLRITRPALQADARNRLITMPTRIASGRGGCKTG